MRAGGHQLGAWGRGANHRTQISITSPLHAFSSIRFATGGICNGLGIPCPDLGMPVTQTADKDCLFRNQREGHGERWGSWDRDWQIVLATFCSFFGSLLPKQHNRHFYECLIQGCSKFFRECVWWGGNATTVPSHLASKDQEFIHSNHPCPVGWGLWHFYWITAPLNNPATQSNSFLSPLQYQYSIRALCVGKDSMEKKKIIPCNFWPQDIELIKKMIFKPPLPKHLFPYFSATFESAVLVFLSPAFQVGCWVWLKQLPGL